MSMVMMMVLLILVMMMTPATRAGAAGHGGAPSRALAAGGLVYLCGAQHASQRLTVKFKPPKSLIQLLMLLKILFNDNNSLKHTHICDNNTYNPSSGACFLARAIVICG